MDQNILSIMEIISAKNNLESEKSQRVEQELTHLRDVFRNVDENKRDFVRRHIEQLAWYYVSIADLQASVDEIGTLVPYSNGGGQDGLRVNPDIKTLMDYQKSVNTIVRTLIPLVPDKDSDRSFAEILDLELAMTEHDYEKEYADEEARRQRINEEIAAAQRKLDESRKNNDLIEK